MFEGTLRDNLDPRHVHGDMELWSVLGMFQMLTSEIAQMQYSDFFFFFSLLFRPCQTEGPCGYYGRSTRRTNPRRGYVFFFFFFGAFLSFRVKSKNISRAPLTNNRFESQSGTTSAGFTCAGVTYSKQHSCAG